MAGMLSADLEGEAPAKKRTGVATNSKSLAKTLSKLQCDHLHRHVQLMGGKAKRCEIYPECFCELVCKTVMEEKNFSEKFGGYLGQLGYQAAQVRDITPNLQNKRLVFRPNSVL